MDDRTANSIGTITPLPLVLRNGLTAIAVFGLLSCSTCLSLFIYLTYKLGKWQLQPLFARGDKNNTIATTTNQPLNPPDEPIITNVNGFLVPDSYLCPQGTPPSQPPPKHKTGFWKLLGKTRPNQFLVLIYSLLLADIQQALAFLLNVAWLHRGAIDVFGAQGVCWAQGWFVSVGDLASSVFVAAIAIHTYFGIIRGYRPPCKVFYPAVLVCWWFVYLMALLGVLVTAGDGGLEEGKGFYVRAGAWCWINAAYPNLRLGLHYVWIFLALGLTISIYVYIYLVLHFHKRHPGCVCPTSRTHYPNPNPKNQQSSSTPTSSSSASSSTNTDANVHGHQLLSNLNSAAHPAFLAYPLIYVACTAPLAIGRIYSMAGYEVSLAYFCVAGSLMACNGWLDALLYSMTRRGIVFTGVGSPPSSDTGIETFAFMRTPADRRFGNVVYVAGGEAGDGGRGFGDRWWSWWGAEKVGGRCGCLDRKWKRKGNEDRNGNSVATGSLRGFGMGNGEVMGMAIQCETVTRVVVDEGQK